MINTLKGKPLLNLLKKIGGWPLLQQNNWKKDVNLIDLLAMIEKEAGAIQVLINLQVQLDDKINTARYVEVSIVFS